MTNRRHESVRTWFRSDRFYRSNDKWYFQTREGTQVGPYATRFEAEIDAGRLLALLRDTPEEHCARVIRDFVMGSGGELDYSNDPAFTNYVTNEGRSAFEGA